MGCSNSQPETILLKQPAETAENTIAQPVKRMRRNLFGATQASSITEHYEVLKVLGSGSVGTLFYARHLKTDEFRTLRELNKLTVKDEVVNISREVSILKELSHENICKIHECIETPKNVYIAMEYIEGLNLKEKVTNTGCETYLFKVILEIFAGLEYLASKGIAHCNICPEYVVQVGVDGYDTKTKIIGFLAAQKLNDKQELQYERLRYQYASPELLRGEYDEKTDLWSCGILLYELAVGKLPFPAKTKAGIIECILNGDLDYISTLFTSLSMSMQKMIMSLLQMDPSKRMKPYEALNDSNYTSCSQRILIALDALSRLRSFRVGTPAARSLLTLMMIRIGKEDHQIVSYFRELDENFDGKVSREELVDAYQRLGIDIEPEADSIMQNLDLGGNGYIDYDELKVSLIDWSNELKEKNLATLFVNVDRRIEVNVLRFDLIDVKQSDWLQFLNDCPSDGAYVNLTDLKRYLRENIGK